MSEELSPLRQQCAKFIAEERLHHTKSDGDILLQTCKFSKLQFPKSQIERSGSNVPVRFQLTYFEFALRVAGVGE